MFLCKMPFPTGLIATQTTKIRWPRSKHQIGFTTSLTRIFYNINMISLHQSSLFRSIETLQVIMSNLHLTLQLSNLIFLLTSCHFQDHQNNISLWLPQSWIFLRDKRKSKKMNYVAILISTCFYLPVASRISVNRITRF